MGAGSRAHPHSSREIASREVSASFFQPQIDHSVKALSAHSRRIQRLDVDIGTGVCSREVLNSTERTKSGKRFESLSIPEPEPFPGERFLVTVWLALLADRRNISLAKVEQNPWCRAANSAVRVPSSHGGSHWFESSAAQF